MHLEDIENIVQSRSYDEPATEAFFDAQAKHMKSRRQFGEIAHIKFGNKIKGKLEDRGKPMMYLGRARNHGADTFRFLNL